MNKPLRLSHPLIKIINNSLIDLPAPTNISFWWNFGSVLGLCLVIQIVTGLFLAMHYTSNIEMAFSSVVHICRDVNNGWIIRTLHANGASMFFICIYLHVVRGIYYGSYMYMHTWMIGTVILFLVMTSNKNMMMNESSIKYFIVQAMASTMLLFSILLIQMKYPMGWETEFIPSMMISSSLLLKIGAAPFHFWFPEVMGASSWNNCLTLMTWQKIAPMMVLSYCIQLSTFIWTIIILSINIGAMGGLNQTSLRQLLAYSSISHLIMLIMMM